MYRNKNKTRLSPLKTDLLWRTATAYCLALIAARFTTGVPLLTLTNKAVLPFLIPFVLFFLLLSGLDLLVPDKAVSVRALPPAFFCLCLSALRDNKDPRLPFLLAGLWALLFYLRRKRLPDGAKKPLSAKHAAVITVCGGVLFTLFLAFWGYLRVKTYTSPNFDYGIFCQSFYRMRETGLPLVTCERDRLLSHFAVHLSPSLYLLLPAFMLFPFPATLNVLQAVFLGAAVFPLYLLTGRLGLSPRRRAAAVILYLLLPAVNLGVGYDFHENCLLPLMLFFVFYFFERKKPLPAFVFAVLTLGVKEDAAVYLLFFALYAFFGRRRRGFGAGLFVFAAGYFLLATYLLKTYGDGVMTGRYDNFIPEGGSLFSAVRTVLLDPLFVLPELIAGQTVPDENKLLYILQALVPLGLLPLFAKKPTRLFLLCPLLLVNLMTRYRYQYDAGFQYGFGSAACLVYLTALNLPDLSPAHVKTALSTGLVTGLLCFYVGPAARAFGPLRALADEREAYAATDAFLETIPKDAKVAASTCLIPRLSDRETLYEDHYHDPVPGERIDLVLIDLRYEHKETLDKFLAAGYVHTKTLTLDGRDLIFVLEPG